MRHSLKYHLAAKRYRLRRLRQRLKSIAARVPTIGDMCNIEKARRALK